MANQDRKTLEIQLKHGLVEVSLLPEVAPDHVKRIIKLSDEGHSDNIALHRVIDGFMAQTGDVQYGNSKDKQKTLYEKMYNYGEYTKSFE